MKAMVESLGRRMRGMVTRGKVVSAQISPVRTFVQLSGLSDEVKQQVELMLPYGMSAVPTGDEDLVLLQVGGTRSHLLALCADASGLRITDLQAGEFGWKDANAQQVVFRNDRLEINTTKKVVGTASEWDLTGDVKVTGNIVATGDITDHTRSMQGDRDIYNLHKHTGVQGGSGSTGTTDHPE